jgi:alkylhydroperoxidase family enzyme
MESIMSRISALEPDDASPEQASAYHDEIARVGQVTNMKKAILHSLPAYKTYKGFYALQQAAKELVGVRAFNVFAYAISTGSDCVLCATFFRRLLKEEGIEPKDFAPTEIEAVLLKVGQVIGERKGELSDETWQELRQHFDEPGIVTLVGFAGTMVATNIFNTILEVDLDDYLEPFVVETEPA